MYTGKLILVFLTICLCISCTRKRSDAANQITSLYKNGIKVDGLLDDWPRSQEILLSGEKSRSENSAVIMSAWDEKYLYFSYQVADTALVSFQSSQDHPELFKDDMAELLLDCINDKDSCWDADDIVYHINLLGFKKDDRGTNECRSDASWNGNALIAVKTRGNINDSTGRDEGYTVEIGIPWTETGLKPGRKTRIGINFAVGDNDGNDSRLFDWVGAMPYRSPYAYGDLTLEKN